MEYMQHISKQHLENTNCLKKLKQAENEYEQTIPKLEHFRDKLSVDIMVPIPSNNSPLAFMEGTAVHTNELLVALGAKYFAVMTAKDAIDFCNRKCKNLEQKQQELFNEQKLLLERISFMNSQTLGEKEIVEHFNEEEENLWREEHAKNVKKMKAQEAIERQKMNEKPADYYFSRLEELEAEELETEALNDFLINMD